VTELKIGYQGPLYYPWYDWAKQYAASYAFLLGAGDGYYGTSEAAFTREMQRRLGIVQDGVFGDRTAAAAKYRWPGAAAPPAVPPRRPIWWYSHPGSGAEYWLGPSHDVGEMLCGRAFNEPHRQSLDINHQPVKSAIGGYLGLMGGDSKLSYLEVLADLLASQRWLLQNNPDVTRALAARRADPHAVVDVELWFSGYSQKAEGICLAVAELFGDGGEFEPIRDRINGVLCFGNPATPVTGIARKVLPAWLNRLVTNINMKDDFYAVAKDPIRPAFYAEIVKAEMELPFFVHLLRIALPIILEWAATIMPILSPLLAGSPFGPMAQMALPMISGLGQLGNNPALGGLLGLAGGGQDMATTKRIEDILSPSGVLENIPALIQLVGALPGLQSHGAYHATMPPRPEFGDRTGTQYAYDIVANFRR
jgi:hypothetical protein